VNRHRGDEQYKGTKCKFYVTVQAVPSVLQLSLNVMGLTIIAESSRPEVDVWGQSTYGLRVVRLVRSDFCAKYSHKKPEMSEWCKRFVATGHQLGLPTRIPRSCFVAL